MALPVQPSQETRTQGKGKRESLLSLRTKANLKLPNYYRILYEEKKLLGWASKTVQAK